MGDSGHDATLPAQASAAGSAETLADETPRPSGDLSALPAVDREAYTIGGELARGGMGRILAARDRRLRRDVVLKVMHGDDGRTDPRFEREALITAKLQHPSIVRVYEAGALGGEQAFYAMERVRGESLEVVLSRAKSRRDRIALLPHAIAVADALAYAHNEGIVHRDLKPSNVLVGPFGETVVIDWGLAKDMRAEASQDLDRRRSSPVIPLARGTADSSLTQLGSVLGTPAYMAPEQARGEPSDARSDVFALGALLYTLLSGEPPFRGDTVDDVLSAVRAGTPTRIATRDPQTPPELVSIIEHAMARDPAARGTAKELADELRRYTAGQLVASHSYRTSALLRRWLARHRGAVGVAAVGLVIVAAASGLWVRRLAVERDRAEQAELAAENAVVAKDQHSDHLVLDLAENMLRTDPSTAATRLLELTPAGLAQKRARTIARDAAHAGLAHELRGHHGDVELVVMSPDGTHVATGSDDATVRWWNLADGTFVELRGHTSALQAMVMSPDGRWLATCGSDHDVWLWDLAAGTGRVLAGHTDIVRGAAFSPDGTKLASTAEDGALWLWDVATAKGAALAHYAHGLRPVVWSADGSTIIAGARDGKLGFWTAATGEARFASTGDGAIHTLARSRDGSHLAIGGGDGRVLLLDASGAIVRTLASHHELTRDVQFTPDGKKLVSAGGDKAVRVDDVADSDAIELAGNDAGVKHIAISADGRWVASAGLDGVARVWPIEGGPAAFTLRGHRGPVKAVAFTPEGDRLVSGSEDDTARIWRLAADDDVPTEPDALADWIRARTNVVP
jgi:WD40 repeat protein/predicted Ser/Thr protein kinase